MKQRARFQMRPLATALAVLVCASLFAPACAEGVSSRRVYVPNEYIVHARTGSTLQAVEESVSRLGATLVHQLPMADTYLIRMGRTGAQMGHMNRPASAPVRWVIDRIQPNYLYYPCSLPNDEHWLKQWDMKLIDMPAAWDLEKGSSSVTVAVIDTGVANHPDLSARLVAGYDFIDNDSDPSNDLVGHGTHCSGTIAAQGNNSIGIAGVCWNSVKIMPVRVFGTEGSPTSILAQGEDYAFQHGAKVFNMSYGGYGDDPVRGAALQTMADAGVILCAAAGNDAVDIPHYPSAYDCVISVSSVGPYDAPAPYTNFGETIDIAAPGGDSSLGPDAAVWSTSVTAADTATPNYIYEYMQGTSMACPHVAGAAALLLSFNVPAAEVRSRLQNSARPPKSGGMDALYYGAGILDVHAALANAILKITQPAKGGTTGTNPEFRIAIQGISTTSVRVYLDYADLNDDGIPDDPDEGVVIDGTNVNYYLNSTHTAITFKWSDFSQSQMSSGRHYVYATATAAAGGAEVSDWAAFSVSQRLVPRGIHMFAFPYAFTNRQTDTPSLALPDARFGLSDTPRATLMRWIAAPRSATDATPFGYETYAPGNAGDRVWNNPLYTIAGVSIPTGGGYGTYQDPFDFLNLAQRTFSFPAGSGFWLILPNDVYVDESWADATRGPLESLTGFDGSKGFDIRLYRGWNMIGNPYTHAVPWRAALFTYRGVTKSLLDAEVAGWVRSTIYGYGGATTGYIRVSDRSMLEPYSGYWITALVGGASNGDALVLNILP